MTNQKVQIVNVVQQIKQEKMQEVDRLKKLRPTSTLMALAEEQALPKCLIDALPLRGNALLGECRRVDPVSGLSKEDYDPVSLALYYQRMKAVGLLVATDQIFLDGNPTDLHLIAESAEIPVVRHDFIVDEYQIYQSRALGADSLILNAGLLDEAQCQYFMEICREFTMEAIVQVHDEESLAVAMRTDAKLFYVTSDLLGRGVRGNRKPWSLAKQLRSVHRHALMIGDSGTGDESTTLLAESRLCSALVLGTNVPRTFGSVDTGQEIGGRIG